MKICYDCSHIYTTQAEPDWSDVTPGWDFGLECLKNHWRFNVYKASTKSLKECLETADTCPDYEHVDHRSDLS